MNKPLRHFEKYFNPKAKQVSGALTNQPIKSTQHSVATTVGL